MHHIIREESAEAVGPAFCSASVDLHSVYTSSASLFSLVITLLIASDSGLFKYTHCLAQATIIQTTFIVVVLS